MSVGRRDNSALLSKYLEDKNGNSLRLMQRLVYLTFSEIVYLRKLLPEEHFVVKNILGNVLHVPNVNASAKMAQLHRILRGSAEAVSEKRIDSIHLSIHHSKQEPDKADEAFVMRIAYADEEESMELSSPAIQPLKVSYKNREVLEKQTRQVFKSLKKGLSAFNAITHNASFSIYLMHGENSPLSYHPEGYGSCARLYDIPVDAEQSDMGMVHAKEHACWLDVKSILLEDGWNLLNKMQQTQAATSQSSMSEDVSSESGSLQSSLGVMRHYSADEFDDMDDGQVTVPAGPATVAHQLDTVGVLDSDLPSTDISTELTMVTKKLNMKKELEDKKKKNKSIDSANEDEHSSGDVDESMDDEMVDHHSDQYESNMDVSQQSNVVSQGHRPIWKQRDTQKATGGLSDVSQDAEDKTPSEPSVSRRRSSRTNGDHSLPEEFDRTTVAEVPTLKVEKRRSGRLNKDTPLDEAPTEKNAARQTGGSDMVSVIHDDSVKSTRSSGETIKKPIRDDTPKRAPRGQKKLLEEEKKRMEEKKKKMEEEEEEKKRVEEEEEKEEKKRQKEEEKKKKRMEEDEKKKRMKKEKEDKKRMEEEEKKKTRMEEEEKKKRVKKEEEEKKRMEEEEKKKTRMEEEEKKKRVKKEEEEKKRMEEEEKKKMMEDEEEEKRMEEEEEEKKIMKEEDMSNDANLLRTPGASAKMRAGHP